MSKMVDMCQPQSMNFSQCFAGGGEVHIIDGTITETINKIDQTPADTPDTWNVKFHRPNSAVVSFGAKQNRVRQSIGRIFLSNRKGAYRWSMYTRERPARSYAARDDGQSRNACSRVFAESVDYKREEML